MTVTRENQLSELQQQLDNMSKAADVLQYSYDKASDLFSNPEVSSGNSLNYEQLETLEALCSRFARASDILLQKLLRLIDILDLETPGSLRDRIQRADKKGIIDTNVAITIRELRNEIAHDYIAEAVLELSRYVMKHTLPLLEAHKNISAYTKKEYGIEG